MRLDHWARSFFYIVLAMLACMMKCWWALTLFALYSIQMMFTALIEELRRLK